ncbi:MAG: hypothetical protein BM555_00570 [Crocinitomix sp. MedPE-SWsnd]|nr:MAG: hypothetical protein BM555_00570 [Crocinitomix sp. MedPE-SWsnd]
MLKYSLVLLIFIGFISCSPSAENETVEETDELDFYFENFPENPFQNLEFDEPISQTNQKLIELGFQEHQNQKGDWKSSDDEVELFVGENDKLGSFKIYFFDQNEQFFDDLSEKLSEKAVKSQKSAHSGQHSEMQFETKKNKFNLSLFRFEDQVRLSFKPTESH